MRKFRISLVLTAVLGIAEALLGTASHAQQQPNLINLPPNTLLGRLGAGQSGPVQAIPFTDFASAVLPLGQLTITGANLSNNYGLSITTTGQTTAQTVSGSNFYWNVINANNDNINVTPTNLHSAGLEVIQNAGANGGGSKYAIEGFAVQAATATNPDGDHIGGSFLSFGQAPAGTVGGSNGSLYGVQGFAFAQLSGSTGWLIISGGEFDAGIATGASGSNRFGVNIVSSGSLQGSVRDAAIELGSTGVGFKTGILLSTLHVGAPIATTGTVIGSDGNAQTVANGIDFSALTITGSAFKSPGYSVDGTGNNIAMTPSTGNANITLNPVAASSQAFLIFRQNVTTEWQFNMLGTGTELLLTDVPNSISAFDIKGGATKTVTVGYTTASSSSTTGALQVAGGVGVGGQISIAGSALVQGAALTISPPSGAATINLFAPSGSQASFTFVSGVTTEWQFFMQTTGTQLAYFDAPNSVVALSINGSTTQDVAVGYSTATTSASTGALVVTGGVGIGGGIFATGSIRSNGGFNANGSTGLTQTCTVNQAKTLIFTLGILTGGSCNT